MRHQNGRNLFSCLKNYSVKQRNSPGENLCTEALAWCLSHSPSFREAFFNCNEELKNLAKLARKDVQITSQSQDKPAEGSIKQYGQFDLTIESAFNTRREDGFYVAIESKIQAVFSDDQQTQYPERLKALRAQFGSCLLISLSRNICEPELKEHGWNGHIWWPRVQRALVEAQVEDPKLSFIYKQFADFLAELDMKHPTITALKPEDPTALDTFLTGIGERECYDKILKIAADTPELKDQLSAKNISFDRDSNTAGCWLGIWGDNKLYVGFQFTRDGKWRHDLLVEARLRAGLKSREGRRVVANIKTTVTMDKGEGVVRLSTPITKTLADNIPAMVKWFVSATRWAQGFTGQSSK